MDSPLTMALRSELVKAVQHEADDFWDGYEAAIHFVLSLSIAADANPVWGEK